MPYDPSRYIPDYSHIARAGATIGAGIGSALEKIPGIQDAKANKLRNDDLVTQMSSQLSSLPEDVFAKAGTTKSGVISQINGLDTKSMDNLQTLQALATIYAPIQKQNVAAIDQTAQQGRLGTIADAAKPVSKDFSQDKSLAQQPGSPFGGERQPQLQPMGVVTSQPASREQLVERANQAFTESGRPLPTTEQFQQSPTYSNMPTENDLMSQEYKSQKEDRLLNKQEIQKDINALAKVRLAQANRRLGQSDRKMELAIQKETNDLLLSALTMGVKGAQEAYERTQKRDPLTQEMIPLSDAEEKQLAAVLNKYEDAVIKLGNAAGFTVMNTDRGTPYQRTPEGNYQPVQTAPAPVQPAVPTSVPKQDFGF